MLALLTSYVLLSSFSCHQQVEVRRDISPFEELLSKVSSQLLKHEQKIIEIDAALPEQRLEKEFVDELVRKSRAFRVSFYGDVALHGIFKQKPEGGEDYQFPHWLAIPAIERYPFNLGVKGDIDLPFFKSSFVLSVKDAISTSIDVKMGDVGIKFFSGKERNLPISSDFLVSYNNTLIKPTNGVNLDYSLHRGIYKLKLGFLAGMLNQETTDTYLFSLDNRFDFDRDNSLEMKLNFLENIQDKRQVLKDGNLEIEGIHAGILSLNFRYSFANRLFANSFFDINYSTNVTSMEFVNHGAPRYMRSLPLFKLNQDGAISAYADFDMRRIHIRAGLFEANPYYATDKGRRGRRVFRDLPILYLEDSAGLFIEASAFEGRAFTPRVSYSMLYKGNEYSYLLSLKSYVRIGHLDIAIDLRFLKDSFIFTKSLRFLNFDMQAFLKFSGFLPIKSAVTTSWDLSPSQAHQISLKGLTISASDVPVAKSDNSVSITYSNYRLDSLTDFFSSNDYISVAAEGQVKLNGLLALNFYELHLQARAFKYNFGIERFSISVNGLIGLSSEKYLYGFSMIGRYLIEKRICLGFSLGWLEEKKESLLPDLEFEDKFPTDLFTFRAKETASFKLELNFEVAY